jgi:hydroxymethylpyrimidine pyrophosphatase-like HAD family hydrolase
MSGRILFTDNEGCLTPGKGLSYDLEALILLRERMVIDPGFRLVLCTGRSMPYCEALLQAVGLESASWPMICEGGPVLYHPAEDRVELLCEPPPMTEILARMPRHLCYPELGKLACLSVYPVTGKLTVSELGEIAREICDSLCAEVQITLSAAAVDITPKSIDKGSAIAAVSDRMGWDLTKAGGFGDAGNDLPMLRRVGVPMCPANASSAVKAVCQFTAARSSTHGLLEAMDFLSRN